MLAYPKWRDLAGNLGTDPPMALLAVILISCTTYRRKLVLLFLRQTADERLRWCTRQQIIGQPATRILSFECI